MDRRRVGKWGRSGVLMCLAAAQAGQSPAGDLVAQARARWQNHQGAPSAEALAAEIDKLEKHIDCYGTIVAKQPDVWGQARLMKHRDEFEKVLADQLSKFEETLQGSISRSDQAFLASAFALSAAVSGAPAVQLPQTASTSKTIATRQKAALKAAGVTDPTPAQLANVTTPTPIPIPTANAAAGLVDDFDDEKVIQRSDIKSSTTLGFGSGSIQLEPTERLNQLGNYINHLHEIRRINEGDDTSASPGYAMHLVRIPVSILPGSKTRKGYGAEITVTATPVLGRDLLPTTFRNLVINDLVGQIAAPIAESFNSKTIRESLDVYRLSKLNAEREQLSNEPGHAGPSVSPALRVAPAMPPAAPAAGPAFASGRAAPRRAPAPTPARSLAQHQATPRADLALRRTSAGLQVPPGPTSPPVPVDPMDMAPPVDPTALPPPTRAVTAPAIAHPGMNDPTGKMPARPNSTRIARIRKALKATTSEEYADIRKLIDAEGDDDPCSEGVCRGVALASQAVQVKFSNLGATSIPALRSRNARFGFPGTQLFEVYGKELVKPAVLQSYDVLLANQIADKDRPLIVQYHKVAGYVQDQVMAAYDMMARPENAPLWDFATPELARAIQARDEESLRLIRTAFLASMATGGVDANSPYRDLHDTDTLRLLPNLGGVGEIPGSGRDEVIIAQVNGKLHFRLFDADGRMIIDQGDDTPGISAVKIGRLKQTLSDYWNVEEFTPQQKDDLIGAVTDIVGGARLYSTTATFAWAILVESVLLNEQLIRDVAEAATARGQVGVVAQPQPYFLPCPPEEARTAFNEYVRTRFPVHVFALDPFVQEQNLADTLARSRELQLALSLAFVSGQISASSMTRFARRTELQTATIAVNRTQLAFSHGEDTFGWRFQPRYQTPPTPTALGAFAQTFTGPTRDGDRRQLELEPGPRECVAVVLMPSFVPYVNFETRSNWYRLTHPKYTEIDPVKFLELSASIKRAYLLGQAICDAGLYRDGDIARLVNRVKQLAAELPMQSLQAQVPYENTHGGFELFNVGITDLAPTLRSWYGIPGVNPDVENLVFLVGDNFSVVSTNVVAGNRPADYANNKVTLLSKQVMSMTIPAGVQTVDHGGTRCVEVSVATPYGVSQPLYIPVYTPKKPKPEEPEAKAPAFHWSPATLSLGFQNAGLTIQPVLGADGEMMRIPSDGLVIALSGGANLGDTTADLRFTFAPLDSKDTPRSFTVPEVKFSAADGGFVIEGTHYNTMIAGLFKSFNNAQYAATLAGGKSPQLGIVAQTTITLKGEKGPRVPSGTANQLTIKFVESAKPAR